MSEFYKIFRDEELPNGRMMSWSKSGYRAENPNSVTYFNANVITLKDGKIWYGDLDLTKDADTLKRIAEQLGETIFVLKESDCRFGDELKPSTDLIKLAVWDTSQDIPFKN